MKILKHITELVNDGYEKIETKLQEIENIAHNGFFSEKNPFPYFQQIVLETKKIRQILRETLLVVPVHDEPDGEGDAA